ncbi:single-stranded DNA-binding protein [Microbacterium sp. MYb62]|uniref:single-stranded DNA-binding protein n=1 Tax=Microbacterium sp. MYb62 TaxID=1848690 RepID=UPI002157E479|nr:single-stranded DNA-binding protein [Microbacterium sp. MYb62]
MIDTLTIVGRVATDPTQGQTGGGVPVTNFRLASTHRRFDAVTQSWTDSGTNWFSVAAFRQLGENAKASLRTGDSVIVTGRLKIRSWESNGKQGTSVDIEADAIGHDLRWGTTAYRPQMRASTGGTDARSRSVGEPTSESESESEVDSGYPDTESGPSELASLDVSWADPGAEATAMS